MNNIKDKANKTNSLPRYITYNPSKGKKYKVQCKGSYLGCYDSIDDALKVALKHEKEYLDGLGKSKN